VTDLPIADMEAEREIILRTTGTDAPEAKQILNADDLMRAQKIVRQVPVGDSVVTAILNLVRSGRPESTDIKEVKEQVAWGPGPRASQALMQAVRARALLQGRLSPSIDDVLALARPVLQHRMALNFGARADGYTLPSLIDMLCQRIDAG